MPAPKDPIKYAKWYSKISQNLSKFKKGHKINNGRKQTIVHIKNRSKAMLGKNKGKKTWNTGLTKNTDSRMALIVKKRVITVNREKTFVGKNNPRYKDGLSRLQKKEQLAGRKRPEQCETCGAFGNLKKGMCFDHDHNTGKFRGWICTRCNLVLGLVKDNFELLDILSKYLKKQKI